MSTENAIINCVQLPSATSSSVNAVVLRLTLISQVPPVSFQCSSSIADTYPSRVSRTPGGLETNFKRCGKRNAFFASNVLWVASVAAIMCLSGTYTVKNDLVNQCDRGFVLYMWHLEVDFSYSPLRLNMDCGLMGMYKYMHNELEIVTRGLSYETMDI